MRRLAIAVGVLLSACDYTRPFSLHSPMSCVDVPGEKTVTVVAQLRDGNELPTNAQDVDWRAIGPFSLVRADATTQTKVYGDIRSQGVTTADISRLDAGYGALIVSLRRDARVAVSFELSDERDAGCAGE